MKQGPDQVSLVLHISLIKIYEGGKGAIAAFGSPMSRLRGVARPWCEAYIQHVRDKKRIFEQLFCHPPYAVHHEIHTTL